MNTTQLETIRHLLQKVLEESESEITLQKAVDSMIVSDNIPGDLSDEELDVLFRLQTTLELISEHQSTTMGTVEFFSRAKIISLLSEFSMFCAPSS